MLRVGSRYQNGRIFGKLSKGRGSFSIQKFMSQDLGLYMGHFPRKKSQHNFPNMRGRGQRPFGIFPKIIRFGRATNPLWRIFFVLGILSWSTLCQSYKKYEKINHGGLFLRSSENELFSHTIYYCVSPPHGSDRIQNDPARQCLGITFEGCEGLSKRD